MNDWSILHRQHIRLTTRIDKHCTETYSNIPYNQANE